MKTELGKMKTQFAKFEAKIILGFLSIFLAGICASAEQEKLDISDVEERLWEYYEEVEPGVIRGIDVVDNGDGKYMASVFCDVPNNPDNWTQRCYELKIDPLTGEVDCTNTIFDRVMESFCIVPYGGDLASSGVNDRMNNNQTYDLYDLNGDGENDRICMKTSRALSVDPVILYLNDKEAYTLPNYSQWARYSIITLENGEHLIYVSAEHEDGIEVDQMFLKAEDDTITELYNLESLFANEYCGMYYLSYSDPMSVDGNTIVIKCNSMTWTFGGIVLEYRLDYREGILTPQPIGDVWKENYDGSGFSLTACPEYVVAQSFDTYLTSTGEEIAFSVAPGEQVNVEKYEFVNGQMNFCLKNAEGKIGWISGLQYSDVEGYSGSPMFEEAYYFG